MARPLRVQFEGALYHVMFRGNERRVIFRDDADRQRFRDVLGQSASLYRVRLHLVCLMPNHVHLLLGTPDGNLSAFMGRLLTAYAVYYNRRHRRCGHLTQGRFKAQIVEGDEYLLKLSRYIHLNPVCGRRWLRVPRKDRLQHLRGYRWSTYRSYAGWEAPWPGVDSAPVLALVASKKAGLAEAYQRFVESGLARTDGEFAETYRRARLSVGSDPFNARVASQHNEARHRVRRAEDVAFRRPGSQRTASEVLSKTARVLGVEAGEFCRRRRDSVLRAAAAWALQRFAAMTQREVAAQLSMRTGAAVSQQTARWRERMLRDASARMLAEQIEREVLAD